MASNRKEYMAKYRAEHREEIREYAKKYRVEHHEQIKESSAKYAATHRESIKRRAAKYYIKHREELLAKAKQKYKENPEKFKEKGIKYYREHSERQKELSKIRRKKIMETNPEKLRAQSKAGKIRMNIRKKDYIMWYNTKYLEDHECYTEDSYTCPECHKEIDVAQVHNHHVEPKSKLFNISDYRRHTWEELENELPKTIPICPECHKSITAKERNHYIFQ